MYRTSRRVTWSCVVPSTVHIGRRSAYNLSLLIPPPVQPICDSDSTGKHRCSPRMRNDITDMHTVNADSSTDAIWLEKRRSPLQTAPDQVSLSTFSNVLLHRAKRPRDASSRVSSIQYPRILMHTCAHTHLSISSLFSFDNRCVWRKERESIFFSLSPFDFQKKKRSIVGVSQTTMHDRFRSNVDASDGGFESIEQRTIN